MEFAWDSLILWLTLFNVLPFIYLVLAQETETIIIDRVGSFEGKIEQLPSGKKMSVFKGIKYGRIDNRFGRSAVAEIQTVTPDSKHYICPQVPTIFNPRDQQTEDCLYMTIYKPYGHGHPETHIFPVLMPIHGGSFMKWSGAMFTGHRLLNMAEILVVSINYRVNVFGFFSLNNSVAPGNLGLLDQIDALNWVKSNIIYFGGNASAVTIYGESAGSAAVGYLTDTELARGLFQRAIQSSGDNYAGWVLSTTAVEQSQAVLRNLSCHNEPDPIVCARGKTWEQVLDAGLYVSGHWWPPSIQGSDVGVVNRVVPNHPHLNDHNKRLPVDLLLGCNQEEGSFLLSRHYDAHPNKTNFEDVYFLRHQFMQTMLASDNFQIEDKPLGHLDIIWSSFLKNRNVKNLDDIVPAATDLFSAYYFKVIALEKAKAHALQNENYLPRQARKTFLYHFTYYNPNHNFYHELGGNDVIKSGVAHASELFYVFNLTALVTDEERLMEQRMTDVITSFTIHGYPSFEDINAPLWPSVNSTKYRFMDINVNPTVGDDFGDVFVTDPEKSNQRRGTNKNPK